MNLCIGDWIELEIRGISITFQVGALLKEGETISVFSTLEIPILFAEGLRQFGGFDYTVGDSVYALFDIYSNRSKAECFTWQKAKVYINSSMGKVPLQSYVISSGSSPSHNLTDSSSCYTFKLGGDTPPGSRSAHRSQSFTM